ncbi:MAG: C-GCAxxG-C-C family protein [Candidatus Bathyarchaeota archaeon]|nr:C-GCAxxG-C-C family protein [Candidatus Bathyarchaeota archaeon]
MTTKKDTIKKAADYAESGFLCSEAVLLALSEAQGVDSEHIPKMASGFAAGVGRSGQLCGAFSGAVMALGLKFGRSSPEGGPGPKVYRYSRRLVDAFREEFGELTCPGVLGLDIDDPDDYAEYSVKKMWATTCRDIIRKTTALAYDLLDENVG